MAAREDNASTAERLVSVTLERSIKRMGRWEYPSWLVLHVQDLGAGGKQPGARPGAPAAAPGRITWPELPITLHKDAVEGYWYNLVGDVPSVFVVCCQDDESDDGALTGVRVTLNQDEAAAHLETDDTVLSIAMPQSLREWLTQFVEHHYKPEQRKKRKRTEWGEEQHAAQRPRAQRPVRGH